MNRENYDQYYPENPELYEETIKHPKPISHPDKDGFVELADIVPKADDYEEEFVEPHKPLPSDDIEIIEVTKKWPIFLALIIGIALGTSLIIVALYSGIIPQFVMASEVNDSYWEAYNTGMLDVSNSAQDEGVIPIFKNVDGKVTFDREIKVEIIE